MFGIGMPELIIILAMMMFLFGAGKLPEIGAGLGRSIRNFRKSIADPEMSTEQVEQRNTR